MSAPFAKTNDEGGGGGGGGGGSGIGSEPDLLQAKKHTIKYDTMKIFTTLFINLLWW